MTLTHFIIIYLCMGCIKGVVEFYVARRAFKKHPHADMISVPDLFLNCILKNVVAWPVFLLWLVALGLAKLVFLFWRPERNR